MTGAPAVGGAAPTSPASGANGAAPGARAPAPTQPPGVPTSAEAPAAPAQQPYRFKRVLKVGEKETPVDLDEEGIARELQRSKHLQARHEATQAEAKQAAELMELLKTNPREALKRGGHDFQAMLLEEAERYNQLQQLTPEQQELEKRRADFNAEREAFEAQRQDAETQKAQRRQLQTREHTKRTLFESLKHCGFPIDGADNAQLRGEALTLASRIQARSLRANGVELAPQELGAAIRKQFLKDMTRTAALVSQQGDFRQAHGEDIRGFFEAASTGLAGQSLLDLLGPKLLTRVIQAQMEALKARGGVPGAGGFQTQQPTQQPQQNGAPLALDYFALRNRR